MPRRNDPVNVFEFVDMKDGDKSVCWLWKRKLKSGRPFMRVGGKERPAYAIALELFSGEPADGRMVLHQCDNPVCCNPHHLRWGDQQKNMNEMVERERHGLNAITVRAIKKLLLEGTRTHADIAKQFGITREAVSAIAQGRTSRSRERQNKTTSGGATTIRDADLDTSNGSETGRERQVETDTDRGEDVG